MASFEQSQAAFAAALVDPDLPPPASIAPPHGPEPRRRFNIYRNNVYAGLIGVLEARFPAIQRLVGDEFFKAMARIFVDRKPPRSPVLIEYGAALPEFLKTFEPVIDEPYLPDVALLEWRLHEARHAADRAALRASDLATVRDIDAADVGFRLAPSVSLISSAYPVFSLWRANASAEPITGLQTYSGAECVLVTRPGLIAEAVCIPRASAVFIAALLEDETLGAATKAALTVAPDFPLHRTIALLIAQKAIVAINDTCSNPKCSNPKESQP
jgi:hypothetical protein